MNRKDVFSAVLILLILVAVVLAGMPKELAAKYRWDFDEFYVSMWKWYGIAFLVLIAIYRLGPQQKFDVTDLDSILQIFHWKNFPANWRETYFLFFVIASFVLFLLTIVFMGIMSPDRGGH